MAVMVKPIGLVSKAFPNPIKAFFATPKAEPSHFITLPVLVTVPVKVSSSLAALIALNTLNGINAAEKMDAMPLNANFVANTPVLSKEKPPTVAAIHLIAVLCSLTKGVNASSTKPCSAFAPDLISSAKTDPIFPTALSHAPPKLSRAEPSVFVFWATRSSILAWSFIFCKKSCKPVVPFSPNNKATRLPSVPNIASATSCAAWSPNFARIFAVSQAP